MADDNSMLVDDISRELVGEIAPEELDIFDDLAGEYHANPNPPTAEKGGDDALGFGLDAAIAAASPAVMAAVTLSLSFVMQVATDALVDHSKDFVKDQVRKLFIGKKAGPVQLNLSAEQLTHARGLAASEARRFGLSKEEADRLADALAGRLAMNG